MHANTRLTPHSRGKMFQDYQAGVKVSCLTQQHGISRTTFYRWRKRLKEEGKQGLLNRSSRPHRIRRRLTDRQAEEVIRQRVTRRWGPARLAPLVHIPPTTTYRCLRGRGLGRLPPPPRPAVVWYEAQAPGELVHLDVLHLFALKGQKPAYEFTLVDDYTRMAYACITHRRTTDGALNAVQQATASFGFPIKRILTDNDVTFAWTPRPGFRGGPKEGKARFTETLKTRGIRHSPDDGHKRNKLPFVFTPTLTLPHQGGEYMSLPPQGGKVRMGVSSCLHKHRYKVDDHYRGDPRPMGR